MRTWCLVFFIIFSFPVSACYWSSQCKADEYEEINKEIKFCCLKGDINKDGTVDIKDLIIIAKNIGKTKDEISDKWVKSITNDVITAEDLIKVSMLTGKKDKTTITTNRTEKEFVLGEIIVKFKAEPFVTKQYKPSKIVTNFASINKINTELGVKDYEKLMERTYKIKLQEYLNMDYVIEKYKNNENVEYAEPNYIYKISFTPNDPMFGEQWAHTKTQAEGGWDIERGKKDIVIAIVDTGVNYTHEDLADNIWNNTDETPDNKIDDDNNGFVDDKNGYDFVDIDIRMYHHYTLFENEDYSAEDNNPSDHNGHGTHCAGIAAAVSNNNKGVAGVCHFCKIMPVRAGFSIKMGENTYGLLELDDIIQGIKYATDNGADIISMSFGTPTRSTALEDIIKYAYNKGVVLVAAAANFGADYKYYPAAFNEVISVGATNQNDQRAVWSNYGFWVDISAPGDSILSTVPRGGPLGTQSGYRYLSGTSMATPYVAGLAGLILSKERIENRVVKRVITQTVDYINPDEYIGEGRVNVYNALSRMDSLLDIVAEIESPKSGESVSGIVEVIGTSTGDHYKLEYGEGISPTEWILISEGVTQVNNGVLGRFDTTSLKGKRYTLRLKSYKDNIVSEDRVVVEKAYILRIILEEDVQADMLFTIIDRATKKRVYEGRLSSLSSNEIDVTLYEGDYDIFSSINREDKDIRYIIVRTHINLSHGFKNVTFSSRDAKNKIISYVLDKDGKLVEKRVETITIVPTADGPIYIPFSDKLGIYSNPYPSHIQINDVVDSSLDIYWLGLGVKGKEIYELKHKLGKNIVNDVEIKLDPTSYKHIKYHYNIHKPQTPQTYYYFDIQTRAYSPFGENILQMDSPFYHDIYTVPEPLGYPVDTYIRILNESGHELLMTPLLDDVSSTSVKFKFESRTHRIIYPSSLDEFYFGVPPVVWKGMFTNTENMVKMWMLLSYQNDYDMHIVKKMNLTVYVNDILRYQKKRWSYYESSFPIDSQLPSDVRIELSYSYEYKGRRYRGEVVTGFDTSKQDKEPPTFKIFYITNEKEPKIIFTLDPENGTITSVNAFIGDGHTWVEVNVEKIGDRYLFPVLTESVVPKKIKIEAKDSGGNYLTFEIEIPQEMLYAVVYGTVKDRKNNPVEGADVELLGEEYYMSTSTDFYGSFAFAPLKKGNYRIVIKKDGYETFSQDIQVTEFKTYNFSFALQPIQCSDSDNGRYINQRGTCTDMFGSYEDSCIGDNLAEYYCEENVCKSELIPCLDSCVDGICVRSLSTTSSTTSSSYSTSSLQCTDSDNGNNIYQKGTCTDSTTHKDYCIGSSVVEFYCRGTRCAKSITRCPNICVNGACRDIAFMNAGSRI